MGCDSAVGDPARYSGLGTLGVCTPDSLKDSLADIRCCNSVLQLSAVNLSTPHDTGELMWFMLPVQPTSKYSLS